MNNSLMTLMCILPLLAMINMLRNQSHFLMVLLSLEGITLSLVLFVPLIMSMAQATNIATTIILLTFGACEASLGLSLMVAMSRSTGSDMLKSLTVAKC